MPYTILETSLLACLSPSNTVCYSNYNNINKYQTQTIVCSLFKIKVSKLISDYVVICFIRARCNHSVGNGILTKDLHFYAPSKTIHIQVKYIIMDYCDQEARRLISLPEG